MRMMFKFILTLFFLVNSFLLFSQVEQDVLLKINKVSNKNDSISVHIEVINLGATSTVFYKIYLYDICTSIFKIYAIDKAGDRFEAFPCEAIIDLESIVLDCSNSVRLDLKEGYSKVLKLSKFDFSPFLKSGQYSIYIEVNYSIVNFETTLEDVYKSNLISNKYEFQN